MKTLLRRTTGSHGQYIDDPLSVRFSYLNHDDECCGDSVLGWVLWELGIPMHGHWPMFSDYGLHDIPFNSQHWCQPLITLHKTSPKDMVDLFRWEFSQHSSQVSGLFYIPSLSSAIKYDRLHISSGMANRL